MMYSNERHLTITNHELSLPELTRCRDAHEGIMPKIHVTNRDMSDLKGTGRHAVYLSRVLKDIMGEETTLPDARLRYDMVSVNVDGTFFKVDYRRKQPGAKTKMKPLSAKPLFIAVEGPDGAGKTTIVHFIEHYLRQRAVSARVTREPLSLIHI